MTKKRSCRSQMAKSGDTMGNNQLEKNSITLAKSAINKGFLYSPLPSLRKWDNAAPAHTQNVGCSCLTRVTPGETKCWGTGRHKNCGGAGDGGDPAQTSYYTDTDGGGGYYYYQSNPE